MIIGKIVEVFFLNYSKKSLFSPNYLFLKTFCQISCEFCDINTVVSKNFNLYTSTSHVCFSVMSFNCKWLSVCCSYCFLWGEMYTTLILCSFPSQMLLIIAMLVNRIWHGNFYAFDCELIYNPDCVFNLIYNCLEYCLLPAFLNTRELVLQCFLHMQNNRFMFF